MAAQPQQPSPQPQPVYMHELNFALDKLFSRVTNFVNARVEELATQMRVNDQESINRDQDSMSRDQDLATMLLAFREESRKQTEMLLQHMNALHGEAMEAINELRRTVNELQQRDNQ